MRKTLTTIALAVTIGAGATLAGAGLASAAVTPAPTVHATHRITEDNPRWNCRTMGNHVCGATLPRWAHWKTAPRGACGHGNHAIPGIVVWTSHEGDAVLICSDGAILPS